MDTIGLPEVDVDPLGDTMLDYLIDHDAEEPYLDFKETIVTDKDGPFAKIAKDILAFSNFGGGLILIGFREKKGVDASPAPNEKVTKKFIPEGLPLSYHVDPAIIQEKFNAYLDTPIELRYREFFRQWDGSTRRLAALYVPPSNVVLRPKRSGVYSEKGKIRIAFRSGLLYLRRGTQSIVASQSEEEWIKKRAEGQGYKTSILSGQPDRMSETLSANLFRVIKCPEDVWSAFPRGPISDKSIVFVAWEDRLLTLTDLSSVNLPDAIEPGSVQPESLNAWLDDRVKRLVVLQLLNDEISSLADRRGLFKEPDKMKFYYPTDQESRKEEWVTLGGRTSEVTVAQRIWAGQLNRFVYWHIAITARFVQFGERMFLRLSPTIQLTENGRDAIYGKKEGTVITRLTYNRYNSSYLNSLHFWIQKLSAGGRAISLANNAVHLSSLPETTIMHTGIAFDRPVLRTSVSSYSENAVGSDNVQA